LMSVPNGLLTIERVFDDLASPKTYVYSLENSLSLGTIACAITSPTAGATVTQGTPVTIAGTITTAGTVVVKLGSTTLGSATMAGLNWSYSWTPQVGDVGAQTLNATATASVGGGTGNAPGVAITVASVAASPLTIMAGHIRAGYSGDVGLTTTSWQDQGPNTRHLSGTCSLLSAALGGKNVAQFNGSSQKLEAAFSVPAPGTSPTFVWAIARNDFDAGFECIVSMGAANEMAFLKDFPAQVCTVTPGFGIRHANGFTVGAWKRARAGFTNSASDYAQVGSGAAVTGAPAANTAGDGIHLGFSNGTYSRITLAEVWVFDQDPGPTNLAALDAWASAKYGTSFP
jgi:hypothetical protein